MLRLAFRWLVLLNCLALADSAYATTVTINADAAKAVLQALQNPALSHEEALKIAQMHGNQGTIRKLIEFKLPATTHSFANALYAAAHGEKVTDRTEKSFYFEMVKPKIPELQQLIQQIESDPKAFQATIEKRIAMFTPSGSEMHLDGYIVAAGDGGGYTFGDTDFFLNLIMTDDFVLAKSVTTHELYHAVQGAYAAKRSLPAPASPTHTQQACANVEQLFANLYEEGTAVYVADPSILSQSHASIIARMRADMDEGMAHLDDSATLLDMSVASLQAKDALPYDDVYSVGFYGHGVLYNIAYVMARSIVEDSGPQSLAALLTQPPYMFVQRYTQLPKYGTDKDHPKLGPNTVAAANQLASGCK